MEDFFSTMATKIIREQQMIIGPVALEVAKKVDGLSVNEDSLEATVSGNGVGVMEDLIKGYQTIFGRASVEVCKDAVRDIVAKLDANQVPALLK